MSPCSSTMTALNQAQLQDSDQPSVWYDIVMREASVCRNEVWLPLHRLSCLFVNVHHEKMHYLVSPWSDITRIGS